jgi:uncharacterized protein YbbC (DUF1343 family)
MIRTLTFLAIFATQSAALIAAHFVPQLSNTALQATIVLQQGAYVRPTIKLGIDILAEQQFAPLSGKRVGLLTHPAGVNRFGVSTVRILKQSKAVNLVALFGPEHGIYGNEKANTPIDNAIDSKTGLPIYSLYGKYRKPTAKMLEGLDVLVIDLQDIGTRSYTFISCMKLALEACFENGVEVMILDRPNPLGGLKVDGPPIEKSWQSYVGAFQIPYVHGMTIGELARMAVSKAGILDLTDAQRTNGKLTVVTMDGWRRYMSWPKLGLKWIAPSPNIPDFPAAVGYAMTGLGAQLGSFQHGIGSEYPFRVLTHKTASLDELERELNRRSIPGITFKKKSFKGGSKTGLYVRITDWNAWRPTELSFHMMQIAALFEPNPFAKASDNQSGLFNKHVGSSSWWNEIAQKGSNANRAGFIEVWERQSKQFQLQSHAFWLYD